MSNKSTQSTQSTVRLQDDPTCIAYSWINRWTDKDGKPITNSKGEQIKTLSPMELGGGAQAAGVTCIADVQKGLIAGEYVHFANTRITKVMISTSNGGGSRERNYA